MGAGDEVDRKGGRYLNSNKNFFVDYLVKTKLKGLVDQSPVPEFGQLPMCVDIPDAVDNRFRAQKHSDYSLDFLLLKVLNLLLNSNRNGMLNGIVLSALFIKTTDFTRPAELSPCPTHGHHWFANAESYFLIGEAAGEGMKSLLK